MRRIRTIIPAFVTVAAAALLMQFSSCEKYILPSISLSPDTLYFAPEGGTLSTKISATVKCEIHRPVNNEGVESSWISYDSGDYSGKGEGEIAISVTENPSRRRTATMEITSEAIIKKLYIIQNQKENE